MKQTIAASDATWFQIVKLIEGYNLEISDKSEFYFLGHCREQFKGDRKLNKLQEHYYIQISKGRFTYHN